jgi:NAD(P)-dependent dehydrogenase (short-subunit alcohol dehydrogenase family)
MPREGVAGLFLNVPYVPRRHFRVAIVIRAARVSAGPAPSHGTGGSVLHRPDGRPGSDRGYVREKIPMGRWARPEEIAEAILFPVSDPPPS